MSLTLTSWIGMTAAACTTLAYLPQLTRSWRTRRTKDISLGMFGVMTTGVFLWLVYGLLLRDLPLIAANAVTLVFCAIILSLKLKHG